MKKCLFSIDTLVVWCPTWSKNLGRSLLPTQAHSSKNLGSNVVARVTRLLTQRIMMGINLKTDISDMLLVSDSVIRFWHFCLWAEDKYANSLSRTVYSLISLGPIYYLSHHLTRHCMLIYVFTSSCSQNCSALIWRSKQKQLSDHFVQIIVNPGKLSETN